MTDENVEYVKAVFYDRDIMQWSYPAIRDFSGETRAGTGRVVILPLDVVKRYQEAMDALDKAHKELNDAAGISL